MSPDWSIVPSAIPYAGLSDPQSFNLYSYVKNRPLSLRDMDGHAAETNWDCGSQSLCTKASESDPVLNAKQQTVTYSQTTYVATKNADSDQWTVTKTTVTTTFSVSEKDPGEFKSGSSQTTTGTSSNLKAGVVWDSPGAPQGLNKSDALMALGNTNFEYNEEHAAQMSAPGLGTVVARDVKAHPLKYVQAVGEAVGAAYGLSETYEAYEGFKISFELHKGVIDVLHSLNEQ